MTCEHFEEWISESLDGVLPEGRRQEIEVHVAQCFACRSFQEDLRRCDALLRAEPEGVEASCERIWRRLRPQRPGWAKAFAACAAAILIGLVGYAVGRWPSADSQVPKLASEADHSIGVDPELAVISGRLAVSLLCPNAGNPDEVFRSEMIRMTQRGLLPGVEE